jgi:hypothetical protein
MWLDGVAQNTTHHREGHHHGRGYQKDAQQGDQNRRVASTIFHTFIEAGITRHPPQAEVCTVLPCPGIFGNPISCPR